MNSKGQNGNCIYNRKCKLGNSQYKGWLTAIKCDRKKALCTSIQKYVETLLTSFDFASFAKYVILSGHN